MFDFELIGGASQFLIASKTIQHTRLHVNMVILILHWVFAACANQNKLLLNDLLWSRYCGFYSIEGTRVICVITRDCMVCTLYRSLFARSYREHIVVCHALPLKSLAQSRHEIKLELVYAILQNTFHRNWTSFPYKFTQILYEMRSYMTLFLRYKELSQTFEQSGLIVNLCKFASFSTC